MTLIDTSVLLDLVTNDARWADWSVRRLDEASLRGRLAINSVVYAELSVRFATLAAVDGFVGDVGLEMVDTPRQALFLAAKAFGRYRAAGGARTGVLPDFFIGAQAAALGLPLLTRDPARVRSHFPGVVLIAPS